MMMEVVVTTVAVRRNAQVKLSPSTNRHPAFCRPDDLPVAQQCQSTEGKPPLKFLMCISVIVAWTPSASVAPAP